MNKKRFLIIFLVIILAAAAAYFYLIYAHRADQEKNKQYLYTAKDFPQALGKMSEDVMNKSLTDLNNQYEKLAEDDRTYIRWINIGILKKRFDDYAGAEEAWQKAISYDPDQSLAFGNLADLYLYNLREYGKAEEYYNKVLSMRSDNFGYYVGLAALYRYNMTEKANLIESLMLQGAEKNPAEAESYYMYLADYYYREGNDISKSKQYAQKTLALNPNLKNQLPDYEKK